MARRNRPGRPAVPAKPAVASTVTADEMLAQMDDRQKRAAALQMLLAQTAEAVSPSLARAEMFEVKDLPYTDREKAAAEHAMDFNGTSMNALTFTTRTGFPGFPTLALLAQLAEYRTMHETLADECIRKWGRVRSADSKHPEVLEAIESEIKRIDLKSAVRQLVIHDQSFGGGHAFFKLKDDETKRDTPLVLSPRTVKRDSFVGVRVVEPYWVTPNNYNSIDPSAADFYKPSTWWMLAIEVHATRLQTMISRPVPDMLKPTYSFRGISMSQLAMPYIDNWLRTQQSVSDTVKQFSITGVKTDLAQMLQPGGAQDMMNRADLFNRMRDNRNIAFLDMATEEFFQVNTPLSGLSDLQAQAQEQQSAVSHIPLVKLTGITPSGLNASSEGEIRVWYDYVAGYQSRTVTPVINTVLRLIQLSLFGTIDESIFWEWEELYELTALEDSERQKNDADTDAVYIEAGVVTPEQVAERLNNDANSLYAGSLIAEDLEDVPDDDIAGITDKLMEIGQTDTAGEPIGGGGLREPGESDPGNMAESGAPVAPGAGTPPEQSALATGHGPAELSPAASPARAFSPGKLAEPLEHLV